MMEMTRALGVCTLIPATMLLTVSFFVLVVLRKTEGGLKTFGSVVAALLWIAAALVLSMGVYVMATGQRCMMPMMRHMMQPPQMPVMPEMHRR